jgi:hypothetical protein
MNTREAHIQKYAISTGEILHSSEKFLKRVSNNKRKEWGKNGHRETF